MEKEVRYCKKCLLRDTPEEEGYRQLNRQIYEIPEEVRVDKRTYEKRLMECRQCDKLHAGTCLVCGCFVELRAMLRYKDCPACEPRWTKTEA